MRPSLLKFQTKIKIYQLEKLFKSNIILIFLRQFKILLSKTFWLFVFRKFRIVIRWRRDFSVGPRGHDRRSRTSREAVGPAVSAGDVSGTKEGRVQRTVKLVWLK